MMNTKLNWAPVLAALVVPVVAGMAWPRLRGRAVLWKVKWRRWVEARRERRAARIYAALQAELDYQAALEASHQMGLDNFDSGCFEIEEELPPFTPWTPIVEQADYRVMATKSSLN
jgi:hypothetical protein